MATVGEKNRETLIGSTIDCRENNNYFSFFVLSSLYK